MGQQEPWQATGNQPELYEAHRVPLLFEPMARRLLRNVPFREGQRVLDVACGTGIVARLAAPLVGQSGRVAGLDLSEAMLGVARVRGAEAGLRIEWQQGDATALPFANATFHVILCQQGLQFFGDRLGALRDPAASPPGGHVDLHLADDSSAGSDDMGRSTGGGRFSVVMERLSSVCASLVLVRNLET
jgi:SAM-dependent methyltransferase